MKNYILTIGLEIHCKLLTDSKLFCRCRNEQDFDTLPANTHICPTCMGLPGALPSLSKESIIKSGALGMLLGCTQQELSHFDRKSYFYPDLPMGYQITQFTRPLNINGSLLYHTLDYSESKEAPILEAHIECDTAKTTHLQDKVLLDFNRAGTPLVEIVTAPIFHSGDDVHGFLREIQRTLSYYSISHAEMDKGQMRCDVNISIQEEGISSLGTKVEIKNMNTISGIKRAIAYEEKRQRELLESGKSVDQETRSWNDAQGISILMRNKENALDYRYFPEPDLPPLIYTEDLMIASKRCIGETIGQKIERYRNEYGFHKEYINGILTDKDITTLFENGVSKGYEPAMLAKYIVNYILAYATPGNIRLGDTAFDEQSFYHFLDSIQTHNISDNNAKKILTTYLTTRKDIDALIEEMGNSSLSETELENIVQEVVAANEKVVQEYKNGKITAIGFLVGQVMKRTAGKCAPQEVQTLLENILQ